MAKKKGCKTNSVKGANKHYGSVVKKAKGRGR